MEIPRDFDARLERARSLVSEVQGHLNSKEIDFLFLLGAVPSAPGEVLEIGSYQGRSTVILAEATKLAGEVGIVAVDPLTSPAVTDPELKGEQTVEPILRQNLKKAGLVDRVEFHGVQSHELAAGWRRPLRLLWIDGDHTLSGARRDLALFEPHLVDGGIVAIHDVLHRYPGPVRVFMEDVLSSERYGACGLCGSVGWAQRLMDRRSVLAHRRARLRLHRRLSPLLPHTLLHLRKSSWHRRLWKWRRNFVPHGAISPDSWCHALKTPECGG